MAKIMVVSDQAYLRSILSEALAMAGHRVLCVDDTSRVCGNCTESRPEMVLLDLFMDGTDSWALFHKIKCYAPEIPVMVYALKSTLDLERLKQSVHTALDGLRPTTRRAVPVKHRPSAGMMGATPMGTS
ncbi:MAG: response regulator [Desulfobacterales bacterium]|nr:response regulator [Desulfobacterales bacterium]